MFSQDSENFYYHLITHHPDTKDITMNKITIPLLALALATSFSMPAAFADPPDKTGKEARKEHMKYQKEKRKHHEEMQREARKHREEMQREKRKHHEEMQRESRMHHHETDKDDSIVDAINRTIEIIL
jgi:hypothetical protein